MTIEEHIPAGESTTTILPIPTHILDLLKNAAASGSDGGLIYLDNGPDGPPTKVTYLQLYEQAKVGRFANLRFRH